MLSFPSQNDKKKSPDRLGVLEKSDLGDGKPTYFEVWPKSYYLGFYNIHYNFEFLLAIQFCFKKRLLELQECIHFFQHCKSTRNLIPLSF